LAASAFLHWHELGFGTWLVEEKSNGNFVGEVTFANWMRGIEFTNSEKPEAGWALLASQQGKGYAFEALECALKWVDQNPDFNFTTCMVNPVNTKSLVLARKIGYVEVGRANLPEEPLVLMNRARYAGLAGPERA